jgi:hypothetical protein
MTPNIFDAVAALRHADLRLITSTLLGRKRCRMSREHCAYAAKRGDSDCA